MIMNKYKKFKIVNVLDWQTQKEIDPLKIKKLSVVSNIKYPFYGQATQNNGIISYLSLKDSVLNTKNGLPTILIHSNNQNIVYLETPFYLKDGHGATSVLQSKKLNEINALYIITCIKKVIKEKFTYNEKATKIALKNTEIELPVKENGDIDYEYMESYIMDLINKSKKTVNRFLSDNNLNAASLSNTEKDLIKKYDDKLITYKKFPLKDLFVSESGDADIQQKDINGKGEVVISSGENNNGIIWKSDIKAKIIQSNTITIDMFGNVNFRDFSYKMVTHARVFSLNFINKELTIEEGLFFASQLNYLKNVFSYNNMASWEKAKYKTIDLPVTEDNHIDFEFINNLMKAKFKDIIVKSNIKNRI